MPDMFISGDVAAKTQPSSTRLRSAGEMQDLWTAYKAAETAYNECDPSTAKTYSEALEQLVNARTAAPQGNALKLKAMLESGSLFHGMVAGVVDDLSGPASIEADSATLGAEEMRALWTDYQRTHRKWLRASAAENRARESQAAPAVLVRMDKDVSTAADSWYAVLQAIVDASTTSQEGIAIKLKVLAEMMGVALRLNSRPKDVRERIVIGIIRDLGAAVEIPTTRAATRH